MQLAYGPFPNRRSSTASYVATSSTDTGLSHACSVGYRSATLSPVRSHVRPNWIARHLCRCIRCGGPDDAGLRHGRHELRGHANRVFPCSPHPHGHDEDSIGVTESTPAPNRVLVTPSSSHPMETDMFRHVVDFFTSNDCSSCVFSASRAACRDRLNSLRITYVTRISARLRFVLRHSSGRAYQGKRRGQQPLVASREARFR